MMKKTNLTLLLLLTLTGCTVTDSNLKPKTPEKINPWTHLNFNNDPNNFQFAIVSDRTGGNRPGVFAQAVDKINLLQPEFVLCVGDLIQGKTEDENELNRQWDEFDSLVEELDMPFFYLPGNHDISNEVMMNVWHKRLGRTYHHFVYKNVLFLSSQKPSKKTATSAGHSCSCTNHYLNKMTQATGPNSKSNWPKENTPSSQATLTDTKKPN
ncbi:MAG: metallophosphoesterase family protein [Planctomycetota bacterium]|jgi:hypothetical protein